MEIALWVLTLSPILFELVHEAALIIKVKPIIKFFIVQN
jgi:hypothetical protein